MQHRGRWSGTGYIISQCFRHEPIAYSAAELDHLAVLCYSASVGSNVILLILEEEIINFLLYFFLVVSLASRMFGSQCFVL